MRKLIYLIIACVLGAFSVESEQRMVKILVSSPYIEHGDYRSVADVVAGSIIREFNRAGGMEIIEREKSEQYLRDHRLDEWIDSRERALEVGEGLGADIVIYSTLSRRYDNFLYSIAFLEVERDLIQKTLHGTFRVSDSASEVGRIMKEETQKLIIYIPLPSELADPGLVLREQTIEPEKLPQSSEIIDLPPIGRYGYIEQIFTYYRVFPGELEYRKFEEQQLITKLQFREDLDEELTHVLNKFYIYGDFAIRHNLQAYLIKDCSTRAINLLLANKIPVFYTDGILVGYTGLTLEGNCLFKTIDRQFVEAFDLTHRKRVAVLFVVPKPGRKGGISKEYLKRAVGYYHDEWGKTPTLVEIKDSMFDIISSGLE